MNASVWFVKGRDASGNAWSVGWNHHGIALRDCSWLEDEVHTLGTARQASAVLHPSSLNFSLCRVIS